jgi:hypothetical protein
MVADRNTNQWTAEIVTITLEEIRCVGVEERGGGGGGNVRYYVTKFEDKVW